MKHILALLLKVTGAYGAKTQILIDQKERNDMETIGFKPQVPSQMKIRNSHLVSFKAGIGIRNFMETWEVESK